jgi:N-acetyl-gamma-glutamyl-phosphate/LysW-gamma-L-alpha-aminoadipyl-6-phosphate reductase
MSNKIKVAIMGGTGYAAAELIRRLMAHPKTELVRISSIDHVGENVGKVHKSFGNRLNYTFENLTSEETAKDCDVVFLALPHTVSFLKAPELFPLGVKVIDFSGDYRIRKKEIYEKYYKTKHTNPENIETFVYGLPELNRDKIREANRIANPGCFPTATAVGLLPLAKRGWLKGKIRVIGPTGSSGSGVHPQAGTHHPVRVNNLKSYKPLYHQHQPEMEQVLADAGGKDFSVDFIPMSAPLARGILINSIVDIAPERTDQEIRDCYEEYYSDHPFVRILGDKVFPEVISIAGTNFMEIGLSLREEQCGSRSLATITTIDNLVKGASGQAIQNMNIMFGFEETLGLDDFGLWP